MKTEWIKETLTYKIFKIIKESQYELFETLAGIGENFYLVIRNIFKVNPKEILTQASRFGIDSLPLVIIIVCLSTMIISLQVSEKMVEQGAKDYIGTLITVITIREMAPIMGSFAVISMIGSSMASEIATMKVTSQVDAIKVMKINPVTYLITPKVIAGFVIMPSVILVSAFIGILSSYISVLLTTDMSFQSFLDSVWLGLFEKDLWAMNLKSAVFGGLIALISSSIGYKTTGGAIDVGIATTNAVVWSFTSVVIADFFISYLFFY